jgi:low affinity Fe/Cu permease
LPAGTGTATAPDRPGGRHQLSTYGIVSSFPPQTSQSVTMNPRFTPSFRSPSRFTRFARWASRAAGQPTAFIAAVLTLLVWGVSGPVFHYSDTWQLVINTGTTIVTFLMVFLIQNTQNRDSEALHVKLDELIRANAHARNALLDLEELEEEDLDRLREEYETLAERARGELHRRDPDEEPRKNDPAGS